MNRTQRKLFTLFFILLFSLVAPTVVLLAQGYRFNLENNIFIHSGSITIKSWPRDIDVSVNGEKQTSKTLNIINGAYTINGLKPGKYTLTCSKSGYTSWEKEIEVHSGVSTEFWNVLLFPEKEIQEINSTNIPGEAQQIFLSPDNNNELVLFTEEDSKRKIYIVNQEEDSNELVFETADYWFVDKKEGLNIEWNSNNKSFILPVVDENNEEDYLLVLKGEETEEVISLNSFLKKDSIHKARWLFNEKNKLVLLTEEGNLYFFDYKKETLKLIDEKVSGFDFADYNIYYSKLPNNTIWSVKQSNIEDKTQVTTEILSLEEEENFVDIIAYDEYRIFVNASDKSLIHNENNKKDLISTLQPSEKISGVQFSDDGKKLLCWNDHEVWYYMLRDWEIQPKRYFGDKITITRSSEIIKNVQWMDNYENIVLSTGSTIRVFEVDPRNKTNISDITALENPIEDKDLLYNKNNQTAYFLDGNSIFSVTLIDTGFLGF